MSETTKPQDPKKQTTPPAPKSPPVPKASAEPRSDVATSRTALAKVVGSLIASSEIRPRRNGVNQPTHFLKINAPAFLKMISNIQEPILQTIHRNLGARNYVDNEQIALVNRFQQDFAYHSLVQAYSVARDKYRAYSTLTNIQVGPDVAMISGSNLPLVTAIICGLGPIKIADDSCSHGNYVPFLKWSEVEALQPVSYREHRITGVYEAISRAKTFNMSTVDLKTAESSPYWLVQTDYADIQFRDIAHFSLYSPIPYNQLDLLARVAMYFADDNVVEDISPFTEKSFGVSMVNPSLHLIPARCHELGYVQKYRSSYRFTLKANDLHGCTLPREQILDTTDVQNQTSASRSKKRKAQDADLDNDEVLPPDYDRAPATAIVRICYYDSIIMDTGYESRRSQISLAINAIQ